MTHQRDPEAQAVAQELKQQIMILGLFLASFWGLEISDQFVFQNLWRGGLECIRHSAPTTAGTQGNLLCTLSPWWFSAPRHQLNPLCAVGLARDARPHP